MKQPITKEWIQHMRTSANSESIECSIHNMFVMNIHSKINYLEQNQNNIYSEKCEKYIQELNERYPIPSTSQPSDQSLVTSN